MKISRGPLGLLFAAMLAMVATDVMAQRGGRDGGPGGPGGPGGRGGFGRGGFGGGFGGGGFGRGGGNSLVGLLENDKVKEELELLPDQEEAIGKLREERPQFERPEGIDFRDRSDENRAKLQEFMKKMQEQREEFEEKINGQLEEVLFPEQMERLQQIEVQSSGIRALTIKRVRDDLKITSDQLAKIEETSQEEGRKIFEKMREIFQGGDNGDRDAMREKMEGLQKDVETKVLAVLNSDQKKKFEELKGETVDYLDELRRGGGRGGRGGPGGGGFGRGGGPGGPGGPGGRDRGGRGGRDGGRPEAE